MSTLLTQIMYKINHIDPRDNKYLQITECIDKPIDKLYYIGKLPEVRKPTVAIVGTRKPTSYGREATMQLADALAKRGVVVVSGLALGVDAIAHKAAVDADGITIAVQANGLDKLYPSTNKALADQIINTGGAIISEYEAGMPSLPHNFLERNRIVSGIADVVIITEAARRSGTLNTAAHALLQGKDLYVLPGPITSPMSAGCNYLLSKGAQPIINIEEFIENFPPSESSDQLTIPNGSNQLETTLIQAIANGVRDGDEILSTLENVSPNEFNTALTMLEINGSIKPLGGNRWTLG